MGSIFLSVGVPRTDSALYDQCDPMLIQAALRTFLYTVLGRKHLVFGGHPTISPLILAVCEDIGVDNGSAVTVYQTEFLEEKAPKVNATFGNLVKVNAESTLETSLEALREVMLSSHEFETAVFIGGQEETLQDHELFRDRHPSVKVIALRSTGGASASIASNEDASDEPTTTQCPEAGYDELLDYVGLFTNGLNIGLNSERSLTSKQWVLVVDQPHQRQAKS